MKKVFLGKIGVITILSLSIAACQKDMSSANQNSLEVVSAAFKSTTNNPEGIIFYALAGTMLDKYSTSNPETVISSVRITGLQMGETIQGIDFRPATGELYALGSNSRLYVINPTTGIATFVATLSVALEGTSFGVDFNPTVDRIRIVSNTGQNLRVHPTTGVTIVDGSINPQPASINSVAYTNNDTDPSTGTELYALNASTNQLFKIVPPNAGTLAEPRSVKLKLDGDGGFDIAPRNANVTTDIGLAIYEVNKKSTLFRIDVETGETTILVKFKKDVMYTSLAISPALH
jgi:hypothetical protein